MSNGKKRGLKLWKKFESDEEQNSTIVLDHETKRLLEKVKTRVRAGMSDEEIINIALKMLDQKIERIIKRQLTRKLKTQQPKSLQENPERAEGGKRRN